VGAPFPASYHPLVVIAPLEVRLKEMLSFRLVMWLHEEGQIPIAN
jgi:hypothetical protein